MSDVTQIEQQIEAAKPLIAQRDKALRLTNNRDFRDIILDGFCVQECARYAQLSGDPSLSPADQANALAMAQAAGHIRRYLQVICRMGDTAEHEIKVANEMLDEIRALDDGEGDTAEGYGA